MEQKPYSKFNSEDLILRDELAIDRTLLANERTLLSYLRSAVALIIAGISIMHFADQTWFRATGISCIPVGIVTGIIGSLRFRKMNRAIRLVRDQSSNRQE